MTSKKLIMLGSFIIVSYMFFSGCCKCDEKPEKIKGKCNFYEQDAEVIITKLDSIDVQNVAGSIVVDLDKSEHFLFGTATVDTCEDGTLITGSIFAVVDPATTDIFLQGTPTSSRTGGNWQMGIFTSGKKGDILDVFVFIVDARNEDFVKLYEGKEGFSTFEDLRLEFNECGLPLPNESFNHITIELQ